VDPYPGPDALWLFVERNRRQIIIVLCGVLIVGLVWVFIRYWNGGCAGTKAERAVATEMKNDPLLTIVPAGATSARGPSTYFSCQSVRPEGGRLRPAPNPLTPAVEIIAEYQLTTPMTVVELHNHYLAAVGRDDWHLTDSAAHSLTYCRQIHDYRLVSLMTLDSRRLTITTFAWTDGAACGSEVTAPH
jgi:hypothetical protein